MLKASLLVVLLALAGCSSLPPPRPAAPQSPCAAGEASYACQIERYQNVDA